MTQVVNVCDLRKPLFWFDVHAKVDFEPEHPHNAIFCLSFVWSRSLNDSKAAIEHGCYGSDVSPGKFRVSIFSCFYNKKKNYGFPLTHFICTFAGSQTHSEIPENNK